MPSAGSPWLSVFCNLSHSIPRGLHGINLEQLSSELVNSRYECGQTTLLLGFLSPFTIFRHDATHTIARKACSGHVMKERFSGWVVCQTIPYHLSKDQFVTAANSEEAGEMLLNVCDGSEHPQVRVFNEALSKFVTRLSDIAFINELADATPSVSI